jgi:hypothetical protein
MSAKESKRFFFRLIKFYRMQDQFWSCIFLLNSPSFNLEIKRFNSNKALPKRIFWLKPFPALFIPPAKAGGN